MVPGDLIIGNTYVIDAEIGTKGTAGKEGNYRGIVLPRGIHMVFEGKSPLRDYRFKIDDPCTIEKVIEISAGHVYLDVCPINQFIP